MPYTTPIYDRTRADVIAQNSKAYMNVADWTRIYGNASYVNGLFASAIGYTIVFTSISTPTTASIPNKTSWINALTGNIERMRTWADAYLSGYIYPDSNFVEITDDWSDGHLVASPKYTDVNSWEYVLDVLYNILNTWSAPTISGNLELFNSGGDLQLFGGGYLELF